MKIGAHVSIAGGVENAPLNAKKLNLECFQMFSRSPRGGNYKKINEEAAERFLQNCKKGGFEIGKDYVIHTPYFINLASKNNKIYHGSIKTLREELETASLLKSPFVITHLGSSKDISGKNKEAEVNEKVLRAIEKIYQGYEGTAILVLEIAAGSGNIIGDSLKEIGYFVQRAKKLGIKLGFCFDTCHAFAAGYDLRSPRRVQAVFKEIEDEIGLKDFSCIHFNDSKTDLNSRIDRHEHIGDGKIGKVGLGEVVKFTDKLNVNLYIETKHDNIGKDLVLTKKMRFLNLKK